MLKSSQPLQALQSLTGNNNIGSILSQVNGMSKEEKAKRIALWANENGITKEQLASLFK